MRKDGNSAFLQLHENLIKLRTTAIIYNHNI